MACRGQVGKQGETKTLSVQCTDSDGCANKRKFSEVNTQRSSDIW